MSNLDYKQILKAKAGANLKVFFIEAEKVIKVNTDTFNTFVILKSRFNSLEKESIRGIISQEAIHRINAQILNDVLGFIDKLDKSEVDPNEEFINLKEVDFKELLIQLQDQSEKREKTLIEYVSSLLEKNLHCVFKDLFDIGREGVRNYSKTDDKIDLFELEGYYKNTSFYEDFENYTNLYTIETFEKFYYDNNLSKFKKFDIFRKSMLSDELENFKHQKLKELNVYHEIMRKSYDLIMGNLETKNENLAINYLNANISLAEKQCQILNDSNRKLDYLYKLLDDNNYLREYYS